MYSLSRKELPHPKDIVVQGPGTEAAKTRGILPLISRMVASISGSHVDADERYQRRADIRSEMHRASTQQINVQKRFEERELSGLQKMVGTVIASIVFRKDARVRAASTTKNRKKRRYSF